jgi:hypothetical protein
MSRSAQGIDSVAVNARLPSDPGHANGGDRQECPPGERDRIAERGELDARPGAERLANVREVRAAEAPELIADRGGRLPPGKRAFRIVAELAELRRAPLRRDDEAEALDLAIEAGARECPARVAPFACRGRDVERADRSP